MVDAPGSPGDTSGAFHEDFLVRRIVEFSLNKAGQPLDQNTEAALILRIQDAVACGLAARSHPDVLRLQQALPPSPGAGVPTLFGDLAPVADAAFLNGLMVRVLDWNDTYVGRNGGHPSDIIPAAIASAEETGASGRDLLTAVGAANHVMLDLCDAADAYGRGWDHATYTSIAAAVARALLHRLDPEQMGHALAMVVAVAPSLNLRFGKLSGWKALATPVAIRNAMACVDLARAGLHGPGIVFSGRFGFETLVSGPLEPELDVERDRSGDSFLKPHAAVYHAQGPIELALELHRTLCGAGHAANASAIEQVRLETYDFGVRNAAGSPDLWSPRNRESADHSTPFLVAMTLVLGRFDHRELDGALDNRAIRDLTGRVEVAPMTDEDADWPRSAPSRLSILSNDSWYHARLDAPTGHKRRPMSKDAVRDKFRMAEQDNGCDHTWQGHWDRIESLSALPEIRGLFCRTED